MATEWMLIVKRVMKENPGMDFKEVLLTAKKEYRSNTKSSRKAGKKTKKPTRKAGKKTKRTKKTRKTKKRSRK